jgi:hypothetical protein
MGNEAPGQPSSPSIEALSPVFSHESNWAHFCTTLQGQQNLERIGNRLAGGRDLVGIYVTESAEPEYNLDAAQYGRVVALVRMLPIPRGQTMQNFKSGCMVIKGAKLVDRWPVGCPCETVFFRFMVDQSCATPFT